MFENEAEKKQRIAIEQSALFFESVFRELIETVEMESNIGREFTDGKNDSVNLDTDRRYTSSSYISSTQPLQSPLSINDVEFEDDRFIDEQEWYDSISIEY